MELKNLQEFFKGEEEDPLLVGLCEGLAGLGEPKRRGRSRPRPYEIQAPEHTCGGRKGRLEPELLEGAVCLWRLAKQMLKFPLDRASRYKP